MDNMRIRSMTRPEFDVLVDWAAAEGWNPGLDDAEVFWNTDPEGFVAAELAGRMVAGGSIVSYGGHYGFMGFFIVTPEHRGQGIGERLWHERKRRLIARLEPNAAIGMDGVFAMQDYYGKGGFRFAGRELRFAGVGRPGQAPPVTALAEIPFAAVERYDRRHFPAPRPGFLRAWIERPGGHAIGVVGNDGELVGLAVSRPCRVGHKIGPLFADTPAIADQLFTTLSSRLAAQPIYLDLPELNAEAVALAERHEMTEVFGCAKMYLGPAPDLPVQEIFGVTTFELG